MLWTTSDFKGLQSHKYTKLGLMFKKL